MNEVKASRLPRIFGDHPEWEAAMADRETDGMAQMFAGVGGPVHWSVYWTMLAIGGL